MLTWLTACALALPAATVGATAPSYEVRYCTASTVYLDAGSAAGLAIGDRLQVAAGRDVIAEVEVVYTAEHSASTRVVSAQRPVQPGDTARRPSGDAPTQAEPQPAAPTPAAAPAAPQTPTRPWARARGGIAFGYYRVDDRSASQFDFQQRTARVDLSLSELGGRPLSLDVRFRGREDVRARDISVLVPKKQSDNRLYEAALRYEARSGKLAIEAGRIGASYFSGIGWLDGVSVRVQTLPGLQLGGFFGRRADPYGFGFKGNGRKFGGLLRLAPSNRAAARYEALLTVVHEEYQGQVSRDYASVEGRLRSGNRLFLFGRAEIDWNRGWRAQVASSEFQLSNVSLSAQWRLSGLNTLALSYDGRRNYLTYLDHVTPLQRLEQQLHQGLGATLMLAGRGGLRATAGTHARLVEGGAPTAYSASLGLSHDQLASGRAGLGLDASGYRNAFTEGVLLSVRASRRFGRALSFDLSGGGSFYRLRVTRVARSWEWARLGCRGELGHGVYLLADAAHDFGDDARGTRSSVELGYRF